MSFAPMIRMLRFGLAGAVTMLALAQSGPLAAAQPGRGNFDHLLTTFPLTGVHAITPCESCHIGGQMAGTPTQCEYCHRAGSRIATTAKPPTHIRTNDACDTCHRSAATWTGARFSHVTVVPGTCFTCHNNVTVGGKPNGHMVTNLPCDACHRTVAWVPAAGFNHVGVVPGTCGQAGCHSAGGAGLQAPGNHVPVSAVNLPAPACDQCHGSTTSFTVERMNHNGVGVGCVICHNAPQVYLGNMTVRSVTHQSRTATDCTNSGCHRINYSSWAT
jgi:hypothetical protein